MNRKSIVIIFITVLIGALLSGCVDDPKTETPVTPTTTAVQTPAVKELEGTIRASGAFALYPMMLKWGEEYKKLHPKVNFDVQAGGAGKGMTDVLGGLVDIGMVSRKIVPAEEEKGAYWISITKDAVVPTVNKNNPAIAQLKANGLKREIFEKIFINETIKTWGQATGTGITDVNGDAGLAEAIKQDTLGIGFNNIGFAYDANTKKPVEGLEIIPLDINALKMQSLLL